MSDPNGQDAFLKPVLSLSTLDRWYTRRSLLKAVTLQLHAFRGVFLDVGCGNMPYRSLVLQDPSRVRAYIGLDIPGATYRSPDLYWDGISMPIRDEAIDSAMATEVLEHCPRPGSLLKEAYRVLKPEGILFLTVPFIWPLHDVPSDQFRYTPFSLHRLLGDVGFCDVRVSALGGWDASLAQMIGLWARRRPMGELRRLVISACAIPVVKYLVRKDVTPTTFPEGTMVTGLVATARKPTNSVWCCAQ